MPVSPPPSPVARTGQYQCIDNSNYCSNTNWVRHFQRRFHHCHADENYLLSQWCGAGCIIGNADRYGLATALTLTKFTFSGMGGGTVTLTTGVQSNRQISRATEFHVLWLRFSKLGWEPSWCKPNSEYRKLDGLFLIHRRGFYAHAASLPLCVVGGALTPIR